MSPRVSDLAGPASALDEERGLQESEIGNERDIHNAGVRDRIRSQCHTELLTCAGDNTTAMTKEDVDTYMEGLSEQNLTGPNVHTEADRTKILQEHSQRWVPLFVRQAQEAGKKALAIVGEAEQKKWILHSSAEKWRARLKEGTWAEKRKFIEEMLPEYKKNWQQVAEDFKQVRKLEKELKLTEADWKDSPELAIIHSDGFRNGKFKYEERRNMINKALAVLATWKTAGTSIHKGKMKQLYQDAKGLLETAVTQGALSKQKVGSWLRRIFESGANTEKIEKFLHGNGESSLKVLIVNWKDLSQKFRRIEDRCKQEGTPQSFHFVHLEVFLSWPYRKRMTYIEEANNRFEDIATERYDFLKIRHALDAQDWDEAEELIEEAKGARMNPEDRTKLKSMESFLESHREEHPLQKEKTPSDFELVSKMRMLMQLIPSAYRRLHREALHHSYDVFWTLITLWYNRKWCHDHRHLNSKKEEALRHQAKTMTPMYIKGGHTRKYEANDVTGMNNEDAAIREQEGVRAPQVLFVNGESTDPMLKAIKEQCHNRNFWYWTTCIPEGVSYEEHQFVVGSVHLQMKQLAREMHKRGIVYSDFGPVEYERSAEIRKAA